MSKQAKPTNVTTLLKRAKIEYLSSIVFHTVLVASECVRKTMWNTIDDNYSSFALLSNVAKFLSFALLSNVTTFLGIACFDKKLENLSSIVFHTVLVAREYVKTSKTKKCRYIA